MKRAIITGATGSIGMGLIEKLLEENYEILVLLREGSYRNERIPEHKSIIKKYCSLDRLSTLENDTSKQFDVMFHLAWNGTTGEARSSPEIQTQNIQYSLDAVALAKKFGCKKFIGAGSQAEYGRCSEKLTPKTPTFPESCYGYAKLCAGQMTRTLAKQLGMEHVWVRILSVYGPFDSDNSLVLPTIKKLLNNQAPAFTKGEQIWDFLYYKDAADALVALAKSGKDGKTYVLGSGEEKKLCDYIETIRKTVNNSITLNFGEIPYSENQIMFLSADTSEITKDTGWTFRTSFKLGINNILEYLNSQN